METVGIREFREKLAAYLVAGEALAITRNGETVGYFVPAKKRNKKAELEAFRAAKKDLDEMIESWGVTEEELAEEFEALRRAEREKKRNAG
jgi:antitoxin (DNA-binding transcriptional repressor) of toxin-antitoxin stability system